MSNDVESRELKLSLDNKQFERAAKQSLSTLNSLDKKLDLKNIDTDIKGIYESLDTLSKQTAEGFEKIGEPLKRITSTAWTHVDNLIRKIDNAIINMSTKFIKSLSIDQVTAGWTKYNEKTSSVQTIMNATGLAVEEVTDKLNELQWYADETSFSFTEMSSALSKMTSTGGDIDKLIPMIMGIANATAFAGQSGAQFSSVIYNLAQSYGKGYLDLIDWKSVQNANVASKQLIQTFIDEAIALGKLTKEAKTSKGTLVDISTFSETLSEKWLDKDVMEAAFGRFSEMMEAAYELVQNGTFDTASEALDSLSGQYSEISEKSSKAAQSAKSFEEAISATKDAVSSEFSQIFEAIFGNYEQAKDLWTDLANSLWDIFAAPLAQVKETVQDALYNAEYLIYDDLLPTKLGYNAKEFEAFESSFTKYAKSIGKTMEEGQTFAEFINNSKITWEEFSNFANSATTTTEKKVIAAAHTVDEYIDAVWYYRKNRDSLEELASQGFSTDAIVQGYLDLHNFAYFSKNTLKTFEDLANGATEEAENFIEYTDEELVILRRFGVEVNKNGEYLYDLGKNFTKIEGRKNLIDGFFNAFNTGKDIILTLNEALDEVFGLDSNDIYNLTVAFKGFTEGLILSDNQLENLKEASVKYFTIIKDVGGKTFNVIGSAIKILWDQIFGVDGAIQYLSETYNNLKTTFINSQEYSILCDALEEVKEVISSVEIKIGTFKENINSALYFLGIFAQYLDTIFGKILGKILGDDKITKFSHYIANLFSNIDFTTITNNLNSFILGWKEFMVENDYFKNSVEAIIGTIIYFTKSLKNLAIYVSNGKIFKTLLTWGTKFSYIAGTAFSLVLSDVKSLITDLIYADDLTLSYILERLVFTIKEIGKDIGGLFSEISFSSISENIKNTLNSLFDSIKSVFKSNKTELSDSVEAAIEPAIEPVSNFTIALDNFHTKLNNFVDFMEPKVNYIKNIISSIWSFIDEKFGGITVWKLLGLGFGVEALKGLSTVNKIFKDTSLFSKVITDGLDNVKTIVSAVKDLIGSFSKGIASGFKSVSDGIGSLFTTVDKNAKSSNFKQTAAGILMLSGAILALAVAIHYYPKDTIIAAGGIIALIIVATLITKALAKVPQEKGVTTIAKNIANIIIGVSAALILATGALYTLGKMDPVNEDVILQFIGILGTVFTAMAVLINLLVNSRVNVHYFNAEIKKPLATLIGVAALVAAFFLSASKFLSTTQTTSVNPLLETLTVLFLGIGTLIAALSTFKIPQGNGTNLRDAVIALGLVYAGCMYIIKHPLFDIKFGPILDADGKLLIETKEGIENFVSVLVSLGISGAVLWGVGQIAKGLGEGLEGIGTGLLTVAVGAVILVYGASKVSGVAQNLMGGFILAITAIMVLIAVLAKVIVAIGGLGNATQFAAASIRQTRKLIVRLGKVILSLVLSFAIITAMLTFFDFYAVTIAFVMLIALISILKTFMVSVVNAAKGGEISKNVVRIFTTMALTIVALVGAIALLTMLMGGDYGTEHVVVAAAIIVAILGIFAVIFKAMGKLPTDAGNYGKVILTMILGMVGIAAVIGALCYALVKLDIMPAVDKIWGVVVLMLALVASSAIFVVFAKIFATGAFGAVINAIVAMLGIAVVVGALCYFLVKLDIMPAVDKIGSVITLMFALVIASSLMLVFARIFGGGWAGIANVVVGLLAMLAIAGVLALICVIVSKENWQLAIDNFGDISTLVVAISEAMLLAALATRLGITNLLFAILGFMAFAVMVGDIVAYYGDLDVNTAIRAAENISVLVGKVVSAFKGAQLESDLQRVNAMSESLDTLNTSVEGFSTYNTDKLEIIASSIDAIQAVFKNISYKNKRLGDISGFQNDLTTLAECLRQFEKDVADIDTTKMGEVGSTLMGINSIGSTDSGGISSWFKSISSGIGSIVTSGQPLMEMITNFKGFLGSSLLGGFGQGVGQGLMEGLRGFISGDIDYTSLLGIASSNGTDKTGLDALLGALGLGSSEETKMSIREYGALIEKEFGLATGTARLAIEDFIHDEYEEADITPEMLAEAIASSNKSLTVEQLLALYPNVDKSTASEAAKIFTDGVFDQDYFNNMLAEAGLNLSDYDLEGFDFSELYSGASTVEYEEGTGTKHASLYNTEFISALSSEDALVTVSEYLTAIGLTTETFNSEAVIRATEFNESFINEIESSANLTSKAASIALGNVNTYVVGAAFTQGFARGIRSPENVEYVRSASTYIGEVAKQALKNAINSASPSKDAALIGGYFTEGYSLGIYKNSYMAYSAAEDLGENSLIALKNSFINATALGLLDIIESEIDDTFVITPVLNLEEIQNGMNTAKRIMSVPYTAIKSASGIQQTYKDAIDSKDKQTSSVSNITYNQYNNSPKALSRIEIYRQTKNLLNTTR